MATFKRFEDNQTEFERFYNMTKEAKNKILRLIQYVQNQAFAARNYGTLVHSYTNREQKT
jgi:hypothetical protein